MPAFSSHALQYDGAAAEASYANEPSAKVRERVILAHGWLGLPRELRALRAALEAAGFDAEYVRHYSLFGRFEKAIDAVLAKIKADPDRPIHLIGFSYGGLIMRRAAAASPVEVRSLLLIAVPNVGSPFADWLSHVFPTPAVRRLRCAAPRLPELPPGLRVGCIAGDHAGIIGRLLGIPNDTRVSVMSAFEIRHDYEAVVHLKHEDLRSDPEVLRLAVAFVQGTAREAKLRHS